MRRKRCEAHGCGEKRGWRLGSPTFFHAATLDTFGWKWVNSDSCNELTRAMAKTITTITTSSNNDSSIGSIFLWHLTWGAQTRHDPGLRGENLPSAYDKVNKLPAAVVYVSMYRSAVLPGNYTPPSDKQSARTHAKRSNWCAGSHCVQKTKAPNIIGATPMPNHLHNARAPHWQAQ